MVPVLTVVSPPPFPMLPAPWMVLLLVRVKPEACCSMRARPPPVVDKVSAPEPFRVRLFVSTRLELLAVAEMLMLPLLLMVPWTFKVELLPLVYVAPADKVMAPCVDPSNVPVPLAMVWSAPLSVPPCMVEEFSTTTPPPLPVMFAPALLTVVLSNWRMPPPVASSRPRLVVPPDPFRCSV